jgi:hypothetical protein
MDGHIRYVGPEYLDDVVVQVEDLDIQVTLGGSDDCGRVASGVLVMTARLKVRIQLEPT